MEDEVIVTSYMLCIILKTSIVSPLNRPYFKVGRSKWNNLSLYGLFFKFNNEFSCPLLNFFISVISPCLNHRNMLSMV